MSPLRSLSLRKRLALLVVISVLPVVAFAAADAYLNYRDDRARGAERTLEVARGMSLVVERELQSAIAGLQGLAVSRALRGGDLPAFREQAERFLTALPPGASIIVADADG
ncbi:MAG: sensor histidine kinase, partial [Microvirga sp.]